MVKHYCQRYPPASGSSKSRVLLCGYSAGSLAATCCPPPEGYRTRYVTISYPISWLSALTLLRTAPFTSAIDRILKTPSTPFLSIRGTQDQLVSNVNFQKWEKTLLAGPHVKTAVIGGGDHFWRDEKHLNKLLKEVDSWLKASD